MKEKQRVNLPARSLGERDRSRENAVMIVRDSRIHVRDHSRYSLQAGAVRGVHNVFRGTRKTRVRGVAWSEWQ